MRLLCRSHSRFAFLVVLTYLGLTGQAPKPATGVHVAAPLAVGCTTTTADAERTTVVNAYAAAASGDTICIPADTVTWATPIDVYSKDISLIGAGIGQTVLTCTTGTCFNLANAGVSGTSRISGFTMPVPGIKLTNINPNRYFRIDHNRIWATAYTGLVISGDASLATTVRPRGLFDNNVIEYARHVVYGTIYIFTDDGGVRQHRIRSQAAPMGTTEAIVFESNTITQESPGPVDSNYGGSYVLRFNTFTAITGAYAFEFHGVQGDNRPGQWWEVYGNVFNASQATFTTGFVRGGGGVAFDNEVDSDFSAMLNLKVERSCVDMPVYGFCDGTKIIDQNLTGGEGYACRDQIGRVVDIAEYSGSGAWPVEHLFPAYSWNNRRPGGGALVASVSYDGCTRESTKHSLANRDWYNEAASFTGATGIGRGTRASRPSSCTAGPSTGSHDTRGVAYWATDQGGNWHTTNGTSNDGCLDICTATNTWTNCAYTPATFPLTEAAGFPARLR
jgi:hypothetical protein